MDIEILEMAERKCKFILKNSTPSKANALRRTMLSDIPKMAIDKVEFHLGPIDVDGKEFESVTPLFDEIIAHRLGMVPIPTDLDLFGYQKDCACGGEGCPNCEIMYLLKKSGPCTVYSGDMEPLGSPDFRVKDEHIPIVELADRQSVLIYAHAVMGTASPHVKWQVANGVGYKYRPKVTLERDIDDEDVIKDVLKGCPGHVFEVVDGKIDPVHSDDCIFCHACKENGKGAIRVESDDRNFVFKFETDGSLTAQQVLDKATEILADNAKAFAEELRVQSAEFAEKA